MTTLTPDALALLAALDTGDDGVLPVLADELELSGDPRAAGLRLMLVGCGGTGGQRSRPSPSPAGPGAWGWRKKRPGLGWSRHHVRDDVWPRLPSPRSRGSIWAWYGTRGAAFLALAEALAG